ncbi:MAG: response regulator transcription factor [Anaerovoracaceae bacterium]|jgi:DNA-binding NarL/FixJ family response regulator
MIRTMIVEDNLYVQKHFSNLLEKDPRFQIVDIFRDAFEAEKACRLHPVDLVLMDVQTAHNHSGLASAARIRETWPGTKVVIITSLVDPDILMNARKSADSLWYKDYGDDDILDVILRTLQGERIFPDSAPEVEIRDALSSEISPRQLKILRCFAIGMTYDEIADALSISRSGVRWNLDQMVEKCGFENKHELLAAAIESRLIVTSLKES